MKTELTLFYLPVPDRECGAKLSAAALKARLAACANLLGPMTSFYEWRGEQKAEQEFLLMLKTSPEKADELAAFLEQAHPYDCPCVCRLQAGINPAFLNWVTEQL